MKERIKDMVNKCLITKVIGEEELEKLSKLSEKELIDLGYMSQTSIFDGSDETIEEEVIDEPIVDDEPNDTPVVDDEPDDAPVVDDEPTVVDEPVVDEPTVDPEDLPSSEVETPVEEEGEF